MKLGEVLSHIAKEGPLSQDEKHQVLALQQKLIEHDPNINVKLDGRDITVSDKTVKWSLKLEVLHNTSTNSSFIASAKRHGFGSNLASGIKHLHATASARFLLKQAGYKKTNAYHGTETYVKGADELEVDLYAGTLITGIRILNRQGVLLKDYLDWLKTDAPILADYVKHKAAS